MSGQTENPGCERIFIGLGGNIGCPKSAMATAVSRLASHPDMEVVSASSLYHTPPWGMIDQPDFLNAVIELRSLLEPRDLLNLCLDIERALKRERKQRWGPRIIDMDIIAFGNRLIDEQGLHIPHTRLRERAFVLMPLAEIAPEFEIGGSTSRKLLRAVDKTGIDIDFEGQAWLSD